MDGIPLVLLLDTLGCLGVLGVEFPFCFEGGTVGMASTVLVAWLLGTTGCLRNLEESLEVL